MMLVVKLFIVAACTFGGHVRALSTPVKKAKVKYVFNSPSPTGYIPDGLTEEEWRKIKDEERALLQSKNFGAWGPRFKQVGGDESFNWFSFPNLWTQGYDSNDNYNIQRQQEEKRRITRLAKARILLRRYMLSYLLLAASAQYFAKCVSAKIQTRTPYLLIAKIILPLVSLKPLDNVARFLSTGAGGFFEKRGLAKLSLLTAIVVTMSALVLR